MALDTWTLFGDCVWTVFGYAGDIKKAGTVMLPCI